MSIHGEINLLNQLLASGERLARMEQELAQAKRDAAYWREAYLALAGLPALVSDSFLAECIQEGKSPLVRQLAASVVQAQTDPDAIEALLDAAKAEPFSEDKVNRMLGKLKGDIPLGEREKEEEGYGP